VTLGEETAWDGLQERAMAAPPQGPIQNALSCSVYSEANLEQLIPPLEGT